MAAEMLALPTVVNNDIKALKCLEKVTSVGYVNKPNHLQIKTSNVNQASTFNS